MRFCQKALAIVMAVMMILSCYPSVSTVLADEIAYESSDSTVSEDNDILPEENVEAGDIVLPDENIEKDDTASLEDMASGNDVFLLRSPSTSASGLVVRYEFDDVNGKIIKDSSDNGHDAAISGDIVSNPYLEGKYNKGIQFPNTATNNYISMGASRDYQPANITVAFWAKRTGTVSGEQIMAWSKGDWAASGWFMNSNSGAPIGFSVNSGNHFNTSTGSVNSEYSNGSSIAVSRNTFFPSNEWVHVAVTFNSTTGDGKIYRNGQLLTSQTNSGWTISSNTAEMILLKNYYGALNSGFAMDEFRIYETDLSEEDIYAIANDAPDTIEYVNVTLDANGGAFNSGSTLEVPVIKGGAIGDNLSFKSTYSGYKQTGWKYEDETPVSETDVITEGVTIFAVWEEAFYPNISNDYFNIKIGEFGQIDTIEIVGDLYPTNYVMNQTNSPNQNTDDHQWTGELMFAYRKEGETAWSEVTTSESADVREITSTELDTAEGNAITVTYADSEAVGGIKDFSVEETYSLVGDCFKWEITVNNTSEDTIEIGDIGLPLPFNEFWTSGDEIYETRAVDHSFTGKDSSYIYVTRPSGKGAFLLMLPDASTGAGFEYQDHWVTSERGNTNWAQDQGSWQNGLNVFYIHSENIKKTGRGYLENTTLTLAKGESKTYSFKFYGAEDYDDMSDKLYENNILDVTAVPGMIIPQDVTALVDIHTQADITGIEIQCLHEHNPYANHNYSVSNLPECVKNSSNTYMRYKETKVLGDGDHHIYEIKMGDLGHHTVYVNYKVDNEDKQTALQFYSIEPIGDALDLHSEFMLKTQWDAPDDYWDKVFDDWMMDTKSKRGAFGAYWDWGDDWGLVHGTYLAEHNVNVPDAGQIQALDEYLDVAVWNGLMKYTQDSYKVNNFLEDPATGLAQFTYRGYAYPHIYNTYFAMYRIAKLYPEMIEYTLTKEEYLLRTYNIMKALYGSGVSYNWSTGLMGENTTPDIIAALKEEGFTGEAGEIESIMNRKYSNFKAQKYPYGSEYSYDNTGEEAAYVLGKMYDDKDMMEAVYYKTLACRGLQPVWYYYANPVTNCGENWWQFQYTMALAGIGLDDWIRLRDNGMTDDERAVAARVNYAAKVGMISLINSGQIDSDPANIGTVAWTYQAEIGNQGGKGTGGGSLHNGWRQMSGEADLGVYGAIRYLSSDVAIDPVFGLYGYGCDVTDLGEAYKVIPKDGLSKKVNLINEKIYLELERDQIMEVKINKDGTGAALLLKNQAETAHTTKLTLTGLKDGKYGIYIGGELAGAFDSQVNQPAVANIPVTKAASSEVVIKKTYNPDDSDSDSDSDSDADSDSGSGSSSNTNTSLTGADKITEKESSAIIQAAIGKAKEPVIVIDKKLIGVVLSGKDLTANMEAGNELHIVNGKVKLSLTPRLIEMLGISEDSKLELILTPQTKEVSATAVDALIKFNSVNKELVKTIFSIGITTNGKKIEKVDSPLKVTIDVSSLNLTDDQKINFTGIYYDEALETYRQLGGEFGDDFKTFTFFTSYTGDHSIVVSENLTKIILDIGNNAYMINGESRTIDAAPSIIDGRAMLPLRAIAEALGAEVGWDESTRTVSITNDGVTVTFAIGEDLPDNMGIPQIINDRTFVPVRYIAEQLGANVVWDGENSSIYIYK